MGDEPMFNSAPGTNRTGNEGADDNDAEDSSSSNTTPATDTSDTPAQSGQNVTVYVEGEALTIDEETTAAELRDVAGADDEEILTFRDGTQLRHVVDNKEVLEHADPGTKFEFQPVTGEKGAMFG